MTAIDEKLKRMPRTVRVGVVPGGLSEFITIQAAINWCATQAVPVPSATAPYVVEIWPGIYDEQITMADFVHLKGIGPEGAVVIQQTDATILFTGNVCEVNNVTIRLTTPTAGRNLIDDNGQAHTIVFDRVRMEITTPGALAHHLWDFSGGGIYSIKRSYYAIGGTGGNIGFYTDTNAAQQILLENNDFFFNNPNAFHVQIVGVNSNIIGGGNRWTGTCGWVSANNGTVLLNNDSVVCTGAMNIVGGSICLKKRRQQYEVLDGMWVQHAITAALADTPVPSATAPYTVLIHPGMYNENITMGTYVHLKGVGPAGSVILYQFDDDNIITLAAGYQEIENVSIRLDSPAQARTLINDGAVASNSTFERCRIEIVTPGAFGHVVWQISGGGNHSLKHDYGNIASGAGTFQLIVVDTAAAGLILIGNDFTIDQGDMIAVSIAGATIAGGGNRWAGANATLFNVSASGVIQLDRDVNETGAANIANLANSTVLLRESEDHFFVFPGMQIQHALNAISANGGHVELKGYGTFALTAQVLRAIDDVKITGMGLATRITLDGVTPVITAGVQDGWILKDFDVDAGLVEIQFATNSTLHNITINGLHGTIINPDLGQTNFPGQPVMRLEEIRALNPAVSNIIKSFDQIEYQNHDPRLVHPYTIMRYLERQGRVVQLSPNSGWTDGSTGGSVTIDPLRIICNTTAIAGRDGLAYCVAAFLNSYFGAGNYDRVDWDNKIMLAFDITRILGDNAALRGRVQLKQVNTEGILAALGIGIETQNFDLYGETFNAGRSTVNLGITMTLNYSYRIRIEFFPGDRCDFYVNDQYRGQITTVANLPAGLAGATSYFVASMDNAAVAVDSTLVCSPMKIWNHL